MTRLPRASGVLLHPTSLPGRHGVGDLGAEAYAFAEFLGETGQRWWQMLPLGPTGYGNSPYQSHSSFAGNPLLIDLEDLERRGWLPHGWSEAEPRFSDDQVEFDAVGELKGRSLRLAHEGWKKQGADHRYDEFVAANRVWLEDYALYQALKTRTGAGPGMNGSMSWSCESQHLSSGARGWRIRSNLKPLCSTRSRCSGRRCAGRAGERNVMLMGDVPIFVAHDSADVWARPELYYLDERGQPLVVAGVPPDLFSQTGQLWGNPLYRWDGHAAEDYSWWVSRLSFLLGRVDLVRIDHFRGFEAYWEIPAGSETAALGLGAGARASLFRAVRRKLGSLPFVAEDLGVITPDVEALRDDLGLPGMRVLQFGFGPDQGADKALPHRHVPHCVTYTGTHDNDTTKGWFTSTEVATTQPKEEIAAERLRDAVPGFGRGRVSLGHDPAGIHVRR